MKCSTGGIGSGSGDGDDGVNTSPLTITKEKSSETISCAKCVLQLDSAAATKSPSEAPRKKNLSSMSDIDPDENIVKDMLVKSPDSSRSGGPSHKL